MAAATTYFVATYDTLAGGSYVPEGADLSWTGGSGFIISDIPGEAATEGKVHCALLTGDAPDSGETMTQGGVTADCTGPDPATGDAATLLYPAYAREDLSVTNAGVMAWTGPALGTTHSFFFSGQTANVVPGEILTFADGQQCEVITVESDAGATGELSVRWITNLDTGLFPDDGDAFTGDIAGDGDLDGVVHPRAYSSLNLHRFLGDIADDRNTDSAGNDKLAIYSATPSRRNTDQIVVLLGDAAITDTIAQHMFGGSIEQAGGAVLYSGLALNVTDPSGASEPVLIQSDGIVTEYWGNSFMPDSIAGRVRILIKTRNDDVDINGKRITGKLLEYGDGYFIGSTTLGTGETGLALFSAADGNNTTPSGTVAGAPYNTIVETEGYQSIDFNNGNGAQPFGYSADTGSATKAQMHERFKYIQRRGTSETLFGRNAQLFTGFDLDFSHDTASGDFSENETLAWGTVIPYTGQGGGAFALGSVIQGDTSGAVGRVIYDDDQGTTGTLIVAQDAGATAFTNAENLTEVADGAATGVTAVAGTVVTNSAAGTMVLYAYDDGGTDGVFYGQRTYGVAPADNQTVYGATSLETALADTATTLNTRSILNQYFGVFTGADFNPANFGMAVDPSDAGASDLFTDLLGATQQPPNNQLGTITSGVAGDYLAVYPWDGASTDINGDPEPNFDEATLDTGLTAGVSTSVDVDTIPVNTPAAGFLRIERDSDGEYNLVEYSSWTGTVYTLVGTAPSTATAGNNVMRAFIDEEWTTTGVDESYTAVQTGSNQIVITLRRGGVSPIVTFKGTATFGATGFTAAVQRIADA